MAEIPQSNILDTKPGIATGANTSITGTAFQDLNNKLQIGKDLEGTAQAINQIGKNADDMQLQKTLSSAQLEFAKRVQDRSNTTHLEDGTRAFKSLESDVSKIAQDIRNEFGKQVPIGRQNRFNAIFDRDVNSRTISARSTAFNQQVAFARGDFNEAMDNYENQASNSDNEEDIPMIIANQGHTVDIALQNGFISQSEAVASKKNFSENTHSMLWDRRILEDPLSAGAKLREVGVRDSGVGAKEFSRLVNSADVQLSKERTQFSNAVTKAQSAADRAITGKVDEAIFAINHGPERDNPTNKFDEAMLKTKVDELKSEAIIYPEEQIINEPDPLKRNKMREANNKSIYHFGKEARRLVTAWEENGKGMAEYLEATKSINSDIANNRQVDEGEANIVASREIKQDTPLFGTTQDEETGKVTLGGSMVQAVQWNVPLKVVTKKMKGIIASAPQLASSGNPADRRQLEIAIGAYDYAKSHPGNRALDNLSEKAISQYERLLRDRQYGFDTLQSAELMSKLETFDPNNVNRQKVTKFTSKPPNGAAPIDNSVSEVLGVTSAITPWGYSKDQIDPALDAFVRTKLVEVYKTNGFDQENAEATVKQMISSRIGESTFKNADGKHMLMLNPPHIAMGLRDKKSMDALDGYALDEFGHILDANNIARDKFFVEPFSQTNEEGQSPKYIFGGTTRNGTRVVLGVWDPNSNEANDFSETLGPRKLPQTEKPEGIRDVPRREQSSKTPGARPWVDHMVRHNQAKFREIKLARDRFSGMVDGLRAKFSGPGKKFNETFNYTLRDQTLPDIGRPLTTKEVIGNMRNLVNTPDFDSDNSTILESFDYISDYEEAMKRTLKLVKRLEEKGIKDSSLFKPRSQAGPLDPKSPAGLFARDTDIIYKVTSGIETAVEGAMFNFYDHVITKANNIIEFGLNTVTNGINNVLDFTDSLSLASEAELTNNKDIELPAAIGLGILEAEHEALQDPFGFRESLRETLDRTVDREIYGDESESEPDFIDAGDGTATDREVLHMDRIMKDNRKFMAGHPLAAPDVTMEDYDKALQLQGIDSGSLAGNAITIQAIEKAEARGEELPAKAAEYKEDYVLFNEKFHRDFPGNPGKSTKNGWRPIPEPLPKHMEQVIFKELGGRDIYKAEGKYIPFRYLDSLGKPTIGIGWNIEESRDKENQAVVDMLKANGGNYTLADLRGGQRLSPKHAIMVFKHFHSGAVESAKGIYGEKRWDTLNSHEKGIVVDMIYHMGLPTYKGFSDHISSAGNNDAKAAFEIINSRSFRTQTPVRFAKHWANWILASSLDGNEIRKAHKEAKKFAKNNMKLKLEQFNIDEMNRHFDSVLKLAEVR